jgi:transposase
VHPAMRGNRLLEERSKVCIRVQGQGRRRASSMVTTWGATTSQILALREHLIAEKVTYVVIELTVLLSARRRAEHDAGQRIAGT